MTINLGKSIKLQSINQLIQIHNHNSFDLGYVSSDTDSAIHFYMIGKSRCCSSHSSSTKDCLGGVVVECLPRLRKVAGLITSRVIPNTLKLVVMAALLGVQGCGVRIYD